MSSASAARQWSTPIGSNGRPQIWQDGAWVDEQAGFAAAPIRDDGGRSVRDRSKAKKTRKKEEEEEYTKEELEQMLGKEEDDDYLDDSDDDFRSHRQDEYRVPKQSKNSSRNSLTRKQQVVERAPAPAPLIKVDTYADLKPLTDFKGVSNPSDVVGRRIKVMYEPEAGAAPGAEADGGLVPSIGVVVHYDPAGRMYAVYDGEDEFEGLWVDGQDEWEWVEEGSPDYKQPNALPVPGCWRPGLEAGDIDKIFLVREIEATGEKADDAPRRSSKQKGPDLELYVKWKGLSHLHCQWVPRPALEVEPLNKRRVSTFLKALAEQNGGVVNTGVSSSTSSSSSRLVTEAENDGMRVQRMMVSRLASITRRSICVIAREASITNGMPPMYLVKCKSLQRSSLGSLAALINHQNAIKAFKLRQTHPTYQEASIAHRMSRPPHPTSDSSRRARHARMVIHYARIRSRA